MTNERDEQFRQYVQARRAGLLRTARLLTAGDHHLAEDLVQATLTKLYVKWPRYRRAGNPGGYVYRIMVNTLTDERRRPAAQRERPAAVLPDVAQPEPGVDRESADELVAALRGLPPRMRAAVVFRYFHDLDVAGTAAALGCSQGTVKSQTARALELLRASLVPVGLRP
ncbi:SigE family RNA polymerase sigma factor [Dactylosporangium sp. NPDC049140]|uniref:SigE family RNA polymerase sigma factor n=1 Tax=Dactylosporangium sp. NPDC049140 TaxID=3155647 RepID=UPI0033C9B96B